MKQETKNYKYAVCTRCFTYNHASYIVDAMNGFTMQETTFPVITLVVDDASTDGEPEVIRQYLHDNFDLEDKNVVRNEETDDYVLCFARHKTNQNCYFAVLWLKYNHYRKKSKMPYLAEWQDNAEFIALCEGDDYWIDPMKLQKQVDYLKAHPDCSLVFHNAFIENASTGKRKGAHRIQKGPGDIPINKILRDGGLIPTLSIVYRAELFSEFDKFPSNCPVGDLRIQSYAALMGKVHYINEIMGVYRLVQTSVTHQLAGDVNKYVEHHKHFIDWYHSVDEYTNHNYTKEIKQAIAFSEARITIACRNYKPLWNPKYYVYIFSKPYNTMIGLLLRMMGMESIYLYVHNKLQKKRNQ